MNLQRMTAEVRENPRLRLGLLAIVGIAWLHGLLLWSDTQSTMQQELAALRAEVERLRPYERTQALWQERAEQARQRVTGLQTYLWEAPTRSLAEAAFRDWLQAQALAAGLSVRELSVRSDEAAEPARNGAAGGEPAQQGPVLLRARVVTGFSPPSAAQLLLQLYSTGKHVGVARMVIRNPPAGQEAVLELGLVASFAMAPTRP
jgi:hypothetical protein